MSDEPIRLLLVGLGKWGRNYRRLFDETGRFSWENSELDDASGKSPDELRLAAVVEPRFNEPEVAAQIASVKAYDGLTEDLSDYHAAIIATPPETHFPIAKRLIEAGLHLLVEKPLALKSEEARELSFLALKHQRCLVVGHQLMQNSVLRRFFDKKSELSKPREARSIRLNPRDGRSLEELFWALAPHDVQLHLTWFGRAPEGVELLKEADHWRLLLKFSELSGEIGPEFSEIIIGFAEQKQRLVSFRQGDDWLDWDSAAELSYRGSPEFIRALPAKDENFLRMQFLAWMRQVRDFKTHSTKNTGLTYGEEGAEIVEVLNRLLNSTNRNLS